MKKMSASKICTIIHQAQVTSSALSKIRNKKFTKNLSARKTMPGKKDFYVFFLNLFSMTQKGQIVCKITIKRFSAYKNEQNFAKFCKRLLKE